MGQPHKFSWRRTMRRILSFLGLVVWIMVTGTLAFILIDFAPLNGYGPLSDIRSILGTNGIVAVLAFMGLIALLSIIRVGYRYEWTGFGESTYPKRNEQEVRHKKTVWDWLQLLIVPLAIAAIGVLFTAHQDARQRQIEKQRDKSAQAIAEQQRQYTAVQEYMDKMTDLMLSDREGGSCVDQKKEATYAS